MDDRALISDRLIELVAGRRSAGAWLYDTYASTLAHRLRFRYPYLDAEDLIQDVFVSCFRRDFKVLRRFLAEVPAAGQTHAGLEQYLWNVTRGLVSNRRRRLRLLTWLPLLSGPEQRASLPDPERCALNRDRLRQLDACLKRRSERLYRYYRLRYADGLAPRQIVQATGWSTKATYKLKQALDAAARWCLALQDGRR